MLLRVLVLLRDLSLIILGVKKEVLEKKEEQEEEEQEEKEEQQEDKFQKMFFCK
jgi:Sec-independent protein translocase protein TatA